MATVRLVETGHGQENCYPESAGTLVAALPETEHLAYRNEKAISENYLEASIGLEQPCQTCDITWGGRSFFVTRPARGVGRLTPLV